MQYREEELQALHAPRNLGSSIGTIANPFAAAREGVGGLNATPVQVHLVAPPLVSWGLQRLVQTAGAQFILVGTSASLDEATPLLERHSPDVVVLDLDDGYTVEDLARLYERLRVKVLAITSVTDSAYLTRVLNAGARGILHKREAPAALLKAIEVVGDGELFATPSATDRLFVEAAKTAARARHAEGDAESSRIASLTMRERQTIAAVTSDASAPVKVIASRLCISEHTLRNHLTSIYSKLGVSGRLGLYAYASRHDLNKPMWRSQAK